MNWFGVCGESVRFRSRLIRRCSPIGGRRLATWRGDVLKSARGQRDHIFSDLRSWGNKPAMIHAFGLRAEYNSA